jgi:hypothetical protein
MTGKMGKDEKQKDEGPAELDEGSAIILHELEKHLEKCVGAHCDQMKKELRAEIQSGKLDEAAIKRVTEDLRAKIGAEIKSEYTGPIAGMNTRMSQYGQKLDKQGEKVDMAADKVLMLATEITGVKDVVKTSMGHLEELEKGRIEVEKSKLQSEKALADASKAAIEKAAVAPPAPAPAPQGHCPNCDFDQSKPKPKFTMGCKTCGTGFTKYETDPPAEDEQKNPTGGQGYKYCPGCGSPLTPITPSKKKAPAPAAQAPAPASAPAAPQPAAAQPKAP